MLRDPPSRPIRLLAAAAACFALPGCYYAHVARGAAGDELEARADRRGDRAAGTRPPGSEQQLELAAEARDFALAELGLPDDGSSARTLISGAAMPPGTCSRRRSSRSGRSAGAFRWPAACAYRGYFDEARAAREAGKLRSRGYDVFVGPSIAYSTLGHFRDPVLNTMLRYGDVELAAFIFHELAHQAVYAQDDSDFNEAFANVVGTRGLRRWLAERGAGRCELEQFIALRDRQRQAAELMVESRRRLAAVYEQPIAPEAMRAQKSAEFARLRESLAAGGHSATGEFNNARLVCRRHL